MTRTTDSGRLGERLASICPQQLHKAIVTSAVEALRTGAGMELLDGLEFWRMSDLTARAVNTSENKIEAVKAEIAAATTAYTRARENANSTNDPRVQADYLRDSEQESARLSDLEVELLALCSQPRSEESPESFSSDCDYLAHAIAGLVHHGERAPAELADSLSRVMEFTRFTRLNHLDPPLVEVQYCLMLPADGRVARFGPITCTVTNRAYRNTLRDTGETERVRAFIQDRLAGHDEAHRDAGPHRAEQSMIQLLMSELGWSRLAARTLVSSGLVPLYQVAANALWGDDLPDTLDADYVELVTRTYSDADLSWNVRRHALDCGLRQLCVDAVVAAGGELPMPELEARLAATKVDDVRITIYSRVQELGATPWLPCLERIGDWANNRPKSGRSLGAVRCPHCDGWASCVVRTPETPACLLCPTCLRMPTPDSPVFPEQYLDL